MNYGTEIKLCTLTAGTPLQSTLTPVSTRLCAERSVYSRRYWDAVQAGARIDALVELPRTQWDDFHAEMYAVVRDHVYRVEQAQAEADENNRPIWVLSLSRAERNFDIVLPSPEVSS